MDDFMRNPELAQDLVRVLNDRLKEVRRDLESSQKENSEVRGELDRLRRSQSFDPRRRDVDHRKLEETQKVLEDAEETISSLRADNSDLQGIIEGLYVERAQSRVSSGRGRGECTGSCQSSSAVHQLNSEISLLERELQDLTSEKRQLQAAHVQYQRQLVDSEDIRREDRRTLGALRDEMRAHKAAFDNKERELSDELKLAKQKHQHYKKQLTDCSRDLQKRDLDLSEALSKLSDVYKRRNLSIDSAPLQLPSPSASNSPVTSTHFRDAAIERRNIRREPWFEVVAKALSSPCFPLSMSKAPLNLPKHIVELMFPDGFLHFPERVIYPFHEGLARIVGARSQYKSPTALPVSLTPARGSLNRMIGKTRELFYTSPSGICYAGTFFCARVDLMTSADYSNLTSAMKEALIVHSSQSRTQYNLLTPGVRGQLQQMFRQGKIEVEYLELQYVSYNKDLARALLDMRAMDSDKGTNCGEKRQGCSSSEQPAKRQRG